MPNPLGKELDRPVAVMVIPLLNAVGESLTTFALSMKIRGSPFSTAISKNTKSHRRYNRLRTLGYIPSARRYHIDPAQPQNRRIRLLIRAERRV